MTRRVGMRIALWLLLGALALTLAGCGHSGALVASWERPAPPAGLTLTDLHGIADLQNVFNQDAGKPRLILLVSPT